MPKDAIRTKIKSPRMRSARFGKAGIDRKIADSRLDPTYRPPSVRDDVHDYDYEGEEAAADFRDYDEYYGAPRYAKDSRGNEFYPKVRDSSDIYLKDEGGNQIYARKIADEGDSAGGDGGRNFEFPFVTDDGVPLAARMSGGSFYYPRDPDWIESLSTTADEESGRRYYMVDDSGDEFYPKSGSGEEVYLSDENGVQVLAKKKNGEYFYAVMRFADQNVEYLPRIDNDSYSKIRLPDGRYKYPMNISMDVPMYGRYPTEDGHHPVYWPDDNGDEYYGTNRNGDEIYAVDPLTSRELFARTAGGKKDIFARMRGTVPYYPKTKEGKQLYPSEVGKGQYYNRTAFGEYSALDERGLQYYAKNEEGDEIYPRRGLSYQAFFQ